MDPHSMQTQRRLGLALIVLFPYCIALLGWNLWKHQWSSVAINLLSLWMCRMALMLLQAAERNPR